MRLISGEYHRWATLLLKDCPLWYWTSRSLTSWYFLPNSFFHLPPRLCSHFDNSAIDQVHLHLHILLTTSCLWLAESPIDLCVQEGSCSDLCQQTARNSLTWQGNTVLEYGGFFVSKRYLGRWCCEFPGGIVICRSCCQKHDRPTCRQLLSAALELGIGHPKELNHMMANRLTSVQNFGAESLLLFVAGWFGCLHLIEFQFNSI